MRSKPVAYAAILLCICLLVVVVVVLAGLTERVDALRTRLSETPERSLVEGTYIINNVVCLSSAMRRAISQLYYICAAFQCGSLYSNSVCPPSDVVFKPIFGIYILEHISQMLKLYFTSKNWKSEKKTGRRKTRRSIVFGLRSLTRKTCIIWINVNNIYNDDWAKSYITSKDVNLCRK